MYQYRLSVSLMVLGAPLLALGQSVGDIRIGPPDKAWMVTAGKNGAMRVEQSIDDAGGRCTVVVTRAETGSGDADVDFRVRWQSLAGATSAVPPTQHTTPAEGFVGVFGERGGRTTKGEFRTLALLTITSERRTQSVAATATDERCLPALQALLKTVSVSRSSAGPTGVWANPTTPVVTEPSPQPMPSFDKDQAGAVLGLWHGIKATMLAYAPHEYMSPAVSARYLLFFPDGTYIAALPDHGIDAASIAALSVYERGKYRFASGVVTLYRAAADGGTPTTYTLENGTLKDSFGQLTHRPSSDPKKMSGVYGFVASEAKRLGIPADTTLTLSEGNRFSDHGALGWLARVRDSRAPIGAGGGGGGGFEIANYSMTFRYDDGRVVRWMLYSAETQHMVLANTRLEQRP